MLTRRELFLIGSASVLTGCASNEGGSRERGAGTGHVRINARPGRPVSSETKRGVQSPGAGPRAGLFYIPERYDPSRPAPLIVTLHGAGGAASRFVHGMRPYADRHGMIVVAPESAEVTWDLIEGRPGPDVERIDRTLTDVFSRYAVDPARVCISGFSDGATCALTLGIANGDLFTHVVAFSPGFLSALAQRGRPLMFISHGREDRILPIQACSRTIVSRLQDAHYEVRYREFNGGHEVPDAIADEAMSWFAGTD